MKRVKGLSTSRELSITPRFDPAVHQVALATFNESTKSIPGLTESEVQTLVQNCKRAGDSRIRFASLNGQTHPLILVNIGNPELLKSYGLAAVVGNFAAKAVQVAKSQGFTHAAFLGDTLFEVCKQSFKKNLDPELLKTVLTCATLADYSYPKASSKKPNSKFTHISLISSKKLAQSKEITHYATVLESAITFAKNMGNDPANALTPQALAKATEEKFKSTSAKVKIYGVPEIKKMGMDLFLSVNLGSHEPARLIEVNYTGPIQKKCPKIALVGKGLTFDSGGYCLKPYAGMLDMKFDMCGAATVLAATFAAAALQLPIAIRTIVPSTENLINDRANKPGDVITAKNGSTVEIDNTDAEGRLILADALTYAAQWNPDAIIDAATLTGAVSIALGSPAVGIMGNSSKLIKLLQECAQASGERVWELPLFPEYDDWFSSEVADFKNVTSKKEAGSSCGGIFLKKFVSDKIPWVHMDIAASASDNNTRNFYPDKGASGAIVMTLVKFLERFSKS